jgi:hypothetical protein
MFYVCSNMTNEHMIISRKLLAKSASPTSKNPFAKCMSR